MLRSLGDGSDAMDCELYWPLRLMRSPPVNQEESAESTCRRDVLNAVYGHLFCCSDAELLLREDACV